MPKKPNREAVASRLVKLLVEERLRQGLSMSSVAERAGISVTMVSFVERELRHPTLDTLQRISEALEVSLGGLLLDAERLENGEKRI
jgi:transcriptional regulator with XRE-family HTH domain